MGCRTFVQVADAREAKSVETRQAMNSARLALSSGPTAEKLRALGVAEDAALTAEREYAQSPDVYLVGLGLAADKDQKYRPLLAAFLSGDISKAKAACSRLRG